MTTCKRCDGHGTEMVLVDIETGELPGIEDATRPGEEFMWTLAMCLRCEGAGMVRAA